MRLWYIFQQGLVSASGPFLLIQINFNPGMDK